MPDFTNPFGTNVPGRKLTNAELVRAIRMDVAAELDATSLYEAHAEATDNPIAKKVFLDIANEERVHVGEFLQLLKILLEDEAGWLENGFNEVNELAEQALAGDMYLPTPEEKSEAEEYASAEKPSPSGLTIGSLRE